jgi:tetratricopeptide (TPR) repeat protein
VRAARQIGAFMDHSIRRANPRLRSKTVRLFDTRTPAKSLAVLLLGATLLAGCQSSRDDYDLTVVNAAAGAEANITSLTAAIEQNPSDATAYNVRGTAYGQAGALREALSDFTRAVEINPSYYQAYANRALIYRRMNDDESAMADYGSAIAANPSYNVAYTGRGNIYRLRGQYDLALADFNRAIELNSVDPRAYHNRGLIFQALGNHTAAIADFTTAIGFASLAGEPYLGRGQSYEAIGDDRAAIADFNEAARRSPGITSWWEVATTQERLGNLDEAYSAYVQVLYIDPAYAAAREALARLPTPTQHAIGNNPIAPGAPAPGAAGAPGVTPVILTE